MLVDLEVIVSGFDALSRTTKLIIEFIPTLITVNKMITKMIVRMSKTILKMIPTTNGLFVVQSKNYFTDRLCSGDLI
jgi:hypothetical protein